MVQAVTARWTSSILNAVFVFPSGSTHLNQCVVSYISWYLPIVGVWSCVLSFFSSVRSFMLDFWCIVWFKIQEVISLSNYLLKRSLRNLSECIVICRSVEVFLFVKLATNSLRWLCFGRAKPKLGSSGNLHWLFLYIQYSSVWFLSLLL